MRVSGTLRPGAESAPGQDVFLPGPVMGVQEPHRISRAQESGVRVGRCVDRGEVVSQIGFVVGDNLRQ